MYYSKKTTHQILAKVYFSPAKWPFWLLSYIFPECKTPELIDIIFLVDNSGSPNKDGFQEMINLIKYMVKKSVVGEKRVRFGRRLLQQPSFGVHTKSVLHTNWYSEGHLKHQSFGGTRNTAEPWTIHSPTLTKHMVDGEQRMFPKCYSW